MSSSTAARSVFVGNLPYDASEAQLRDFFSTAGTVISLRLMTEKETGKPKGYGFCEFADAATAASAIRNLNGAEFRGRVLRVDVSDADTAAGPQRRAMPPPAAERQPMSGRGGRVVSIGALAGESNGVRFVDGAAVARVVRGLSRQQRVDVLTEMKKFAALNPEGARQLLIDSPAVAAALLQIQLLFRIVTADALGNLRALPQAPPRGDAAIEEMLSKLPPAEQSILREVLQLSPAQLAALPPHVQEQVRLITQQLPRHWTCTQEISQILVHRQVLRVG